jgi:hypothetical protein
MRKTIAGLFLLGMSATVAAGAADYPSKSYDAYYDRYSAQGNGDYHMASDGKGHQLIEVGQPTLERKQTTIIDFPKKRMVILLAQQKKAMVMPLNPAQNSADPDAKMKVLGAKPLGSKVIEGHPCHGWQYTERGNNVETWSGDDTGCTVQSEMTGPSGTETLHLRQYSANAPGPESFNIPPGYELVSAGQMFGSQ